MPQNSMTEADLLRKLMLKLTTPSTRVFRNHVGMGWQGKVERCSSGSPTSVILYPGDIVIRQARPLRAGLCDGSSDLIGWKTIEIADRKIAIFTAVEAKSESGRLAPAQSNFLNAVNAAGGIAIEVRDVESGVAELERLPRLY
jgi:hypothetical protein